MGQAKKQQFWIGFDLGGTKMLASVFDAKFEVQGRKRRRTRGHEGVKAGIERMVQTIYQSLEDAKLTVEQLGGIGVGCPSPVDLERGIVLHAVNLGWSNVHLKEALEEEFGCPVAVVNDVDAGVYGENRFGSAVSARCVLGIFPGTGIGGGCVYNGEIVHGSRISCMEIGHLHVADNDRICGCGRKGCLETVASRLAIAAEAAKAAYRGEAPHLMEIAGTDLTEIRSGILAEAIAAGDTVVEHIVRDAATQIGVALATLVHLLAPDVIVLGGGLVEAMPALMVDAVASAIQARVMPAYLNTFQVVAATLGDDAAAIGAAGWVERMATS